MTSRANNNAGTTSLVAAPARPRTSNARRASWLAFCLLLAGADDVFAQKAPQLGYVFPPAVRAGAATEVQLGGYDFTPDMQWFVHDERVRLRTSGAVGDYQLTPPPYWVGPRAGVTSLPLAREVAATLDVDAAMPAGLVYWQAANANGCAQTAVAYVSRDAEILESRSRDLPQRLPAPPIAVSGRLSRLTEVDRYEFVASADGLVSVDLMARRIGASFNGMLQVRDSSNKLLADFADTQGLDGGVTFAVRAGETYLISLHDADFRGDRSFVYRLAVTAGPRVLGTLPAAGRRGTSREVEFVGLGIATGQPVLESVRKTVRFSADPAIVAETHTLETPFGAIQATIPLSDVEECVGAEPVPSGPFAVTRVLPADASEQRFSWNVAKDERWTVDVQSRSIGGRLDAAVAILDPEGKQVAENDDLPGTTDAGLEFRASTSGSFTCVVRGIGTQTREVEGLYRLQIRPSVVDFSLSVPQQINLPLGGKSEVSIQASRTGGFDGEIALTVEGLPAGASLEGEWKIPAGANEFKGIVQAAPDAAANASLIRVRGVAQLGGAPAVRWASAAASGNLCPRSQAEQRIGATLLALTMAPPFEIKLVDRTRQREVHRGATCLAEMEIVRKEGFDGEIQLQMAATQSRYLCGSRGLNVVVPAGATRAIYPTWMSEWLGTEFTIRMATLGVAAVRDPQGNVRYLTKPADAQITMIMEGALLKLTAQAGEATPRMGDLIEIPVSVSRSAKLSAAATIELEAPAEIADLVHAEPLLLAPGQDRGVLKVSTKADERLRGAWTFRIRATSRQDDQWPVISETDAAVTFANE